MKQIFYFFMVLIFLSCSKNNKERFIETLTNDEFKYWDVIQLRSFYNVKKNGGSPRYSFYFDTKGNYKFYQYENGQRILFDNGDVVTPDVWSYMSHTTISLNGLVRNIQKLTADSFIYYGSNDTVILARSKNQK